MALWIPFASGAAVVIRLFVVNCTDISLAIYCSTPIRHLLNISTSMIDTPDFYWDRPEVEALYNQLRSALSVSARTRVLNSKLNMCCELTEILSNHLQSRHSSRLEWMIIALILVEIAFEAFYYHERRLERRPSVGNTAVPT
ncbi:hypothetical protein P879_07427 [Paragonimus westermani]|uniref:DUF155 domain-containing protein n=1 Tax=Paragonimus westermani TaxID=34504 RepID=A0A8T0DIQ3_9TREM|nr:hypothetical protein P879_07427 [Paragonimus westermani]